MELDEFKELYNSSTDRPISTNQNIMEMITLKSKGPLAELQKKINYTLYLFPLSIVFFLGLFIPALGAKEVAHNVTLWLLFLILFSEYVVAVLNHFTIKKIQQQTGNVRENLLSKIALIKRRYKWYYVIYVVLFLMMPAYVELGIHYPAIGAFHGVGKINVFIRIAWYILIFGCIFVIKKKSQEQLYDQYLDQLNSLAGQMQ